MFRFEPQSTGPLLGLFRRGCIALEVHRATPLLAVEPHTHVSFRLSASFTAAETLQTLYEQCYAAVEVGRMLRLWPRAHGGGSCGSKKGVIIPTPSFQQGNSHQYQPTGNPASIEPVQKPKGAGNIEQRKPLAQEVKAKPSIQEIPRSEPIKPRVPTPPPDPKVVLRKKLSDHLRLPNNGFACNVDCEVYGQRRGLLDTVNSLVKEGARKTLLITGDSGTGKSWFCRRLAAALLEPQSDLIPVYIDLCLCTNLANAVSDTFRHYKVEKVEEIRQLQLLFIFDSFDRLKPYSNVLKATRILETFPNSSVLVACSSSIASEPQYRTWFVRSGESPLTSLIELALLPLSAEEIKRSALERESEWYEKKGWKGAEEFIHTVEALKVNNPFLLEKCYLHRDLMEKNSENEQLNVSRFLLAAANAELPPFHQSPEDNISEYMRLAFGQPLSRAYPHTSGTTPHLIVSKISDGQMPMFSVSVLQSVFQAYGFYTDFEAPGAGHYFSNFLLTADPSVLHAFVAFLEKAHEDSNLQSSISRKLNSSPIATANCIAISTACKIPLSPCTLPATALQGVDLQGAVFRSIDFSQIDFTSADVSQALFIDCNITEPHLKKSQRTQLGIKVDEASALAVSPDGTCLAYAQGSDIHLVATADFTESCTLKGHESQVTSMCFSDDGVYLVSTGFDGTMRWWKLPEGELQHTETLPKKSHGALAISPTGTVAMTGASTTLWTKDGPHAIPQLPADSPSLTVAFSKSAEDRLASGHKDRQIRIWAIAAVQVIASIDCMEPIRGLCFPDVDVIAATTAHVYCCRVDGTKEDWGTTGGEVAYCSFDGTYLGCSFADHDGGCVFDIKSRSAVLPFLQNPLLLAVSGECLYIGDSEEVTKLDFNSALPSLKGKEQRITQIAVSEDSRLIATALSSREVQVRERSGGELIGSVRQHVNAVGVTNTQLWVLTTDSAFVCYSLQDLSTPLDLRPGIVLYAHDGTNSAFCSTANVIEVVAGEQVYALPPPAHSVDSYLAIRLKGDRLIGVRAKGAVVSWKYASGEQEPKPFLFSRKGSTCGFTSDSSLLAVVSRQNQVEIADIDQEKSIGHFEWPAKGQLELAFVRKDYLIACTDDTVTVCKVEGLQVLSELRMSAMRNVTVSVDGEYLVAGELALEVFKLHIAEESKGGWSQHMTAMLRYNFARETKVIGSYRE